jgi:hypothetical protein
MTATATLVHTTRTGDAARLAVARVAAAGRVAAERQAREARAARQAHSDAAYAADVVADLRAEGAVRVGFKVCDDMGKWRQVLPIEDAAWLIAATRRDDAEVWGIAADGEHTGGAVY